MDALKQLVGKLAEVSDGITGRCGQLRWHSEALSVAHLLVLTHVVQNISWELGARAPAPAPSSPVLTHVVQNIPWE